MYLLHVSLTVDLLQSRLFQSCRRVPFSSADPDQSKDCSKPILVARYNFEFVQWAASVAGVRVADLFLTDRFDGVTFLAASRASVVIDQYGGPFPKTRTVAKRLLPVRHPSGQGWLLIGIHLGWAIV